jgi:Mannosyltransferase (PIG-V)
MGPVGNVWRREVATSPKSPIGRFPWRPRLDDLAVIAVLFALTRLLLIGVGVMGWRNQLENSNWRGMDRSGIHYALVRDQPLLDMWTRWDSWEYEEIARSGYWYDFEAKPRPYGTVACFPLYPMVVRGVGSILGRRYVLAGLIVSNLSAIVGFVLLFQWASWWGDRRSAWVAVSAAIAFPPGVFWSALYPQSLFFALSIASLTLMLDGRAASACLVGALATATRLEGIALVPALLAMQLQSHSRRIEWRMLWLVVTPMGLLGYMGYLGWRFGDPLLFLKVHALFGRGLTNPLRTLIEPLQAGTQGLDTNILFTYAVGLMLLLGHVARLRWPILLYGWLLYLIPLCTGVYMSIYRVQLVDAPIYLALGLGLAGRWRFLAWGLVCLFLYGQLRMMFEWAIGYFVP